MRHAIHRFVEAHGVKMFGAQAKGAGNGSEVYRTAVHGVTSPLDAADMLTHRNTAFGKVPAVAGIARKMGFRDHGSTQCDPESE